MRFLLIITLLIITGCSGSKNNPVEIRHAPAQVSQHKLLGIWNVSFDKNMEEAVIEPDRIINAHLNVSELIPSPKIKINSFNPMAHVIDVDVTLTNPYAVDVYDVRLIIYNTEESYHMLLNPDDWTSLYDISGGLPINPFRAYAKGEPNRRFSGRTQHTENLQIYIPPRNWNVKFAVDASLPGNCAEPFEISNFSQGTIYDERGSSTQIKVNVRDWQNDVESVNLYCPEITNQQLLSFTQTQPEVWKATLFNNTGTHYGEYYGWIIAMSSGEFIYDQVTIIINPISTAPWIDARQLALQDSMDDSVQGEDWFIFYCPPNGIESGSIQLTVDIGTVGMILYGSDLNEGSPGQEIGRDNIIVLDENPKSRYFIEVTGNGDYVLEINLIPKLTNINCEIYVATDDGTENGTWPVQEYNNEELTVETLNTMLTWCNNFYNQYGYNLVWDGTVTIMSAEYYIVEWPEDEQMHNEYGRGTDMLSLYFVQSGWTAYTIPRYPETEQVVNSVFSVYSPNIWYWEDVIAHEHGHEFGYLIDQYLYGMTPCECGDWECLEQYADEEAKYLYSDPNACYEGNLMWYYIYNSGWEDYSITLPGQAQWIYGFHFRNPDNFPWY